MNFTGHVADAIVNQLRNFTGEDIYMDGSQTLEQLELDSLDAIDLLFRLEQEFDIDLDHEHLSLKTTMIGDIIRIVENKLVKR